MCQWKATLESREPHSGNATSPDLAGIFADKLQIQTYFATTKALQPLSDFERVRASLLAVFERSEVLISLSSYSWQVSSCSRLLRGSGTAV
jgi:hypothetical protein